MITVIKMTKVGLDVTYEYVGKSTDEKPVSSNGSKLTEMDTGDEYFFDGDEQGWTKEADKYLASLEIATAPTKVQYYVGDEFDATGMVVKAVYDDDTKATITDYTIDAPATLSVSDTKVTIKYTETGRTRSVEQEITVSEIELASIAFTQDPTLTYFDGDMLDLDGVEITATYNNGDTKVVTEACTFSPADGAVLDVDMTTLTATYVEGEITKTAEKTLTVNPVVLSSIAFTHDPTKVAYAVGEELSLAGAEVTATYNNTATRVVTSECTFAPEEGATLTAEDTSVTATFTEEGVTKTATVTITVSGS